MVRKLFIWTEKILYGHKFIYPVTKFIYPVRNNFIWTERQYKMSILLQKGSWNVLIPTAFFNITNLLII